MRGETNARKAVGGPAEERIPRMPRERGDKIISRDPKWAVLWRCWKKPFSGAAANSAQVQIIYLDPRWEERETLMSDQVGTKRRWPLFIGHIAPLFAEAHTKCTVSHFESLLFASWYSPVSEFKMAALCTSVGFFFPLSSCGSANPHTPPHTVGVFSGCVRLWCPGRTAELRRNANALLLVRLSRSRELMHTRWGHTGAIQWSAAVYHQHRLRVAARLLLATRLFIATTCHSRCLQLSLSRFQYLLSQGRAADTEHCGSRSLEGISSLQQALCTLT